jgi:hypothetical protein
LGIRISSEKQPALEQNILIRAIRIAWGNLSPTPYVNAERQQYQPQATNISSICSLRSAHFKTKVVTLFSQVLGESSVFEALLPVKRASKRKGNNF